MIRKSTAQWVGSGQDGRGSLTTSSGALRATPYSAKARFTPEGGLPETNPEELLAAAHAGCFTMALAYQLAGAGFPPAELVTEASVALDMINGAPKITAIQLSVVADVPKIPADTFAAIASQAKEGCPVSQALAACSITLVTKLK